MAASWAISPGGSLHLDDGGLGVGGYGEDGEGNAYVVIEIAFCGYGLVFLGEDGGGQLLCCRLAVGACYADDGYGELLAMVCCELLECLERVGRDEGTGVGDEIGVGGHYESCSAVECLRDHGVGVEVVAFERDEERAIRLWYGCRLRRLLKRGKPCRDLQ